MNFGLGCEYVSATEGGIESVKKNAPGAAAEDLLGSSKDGSRPALTLRTDLAASV